MADEEKDEQVEYPLNLNQLYDLEGLATTYKSSAFGTASAALDELDLRADSPEAATIFKYVSTIETLADALPLFLQDSSIPYEERMEMIDRCRKRLREIDRELDAYIEKLRQAQQDKTDS